MERRALAALTYKRSLPGERRDFKSCNLFSTDAPNKPPRKDRRAPSQRSQVPGETSCSAGERAPVGLVGRPQKQRPKTPGIPSQGNTVTVTSPSCKASSSAPSHLPRPATPPPSPTTHRVFSFLFFFPPEYFPPATRFSPPRTHGEKKKSRFRKTHPRILLSELEANPCGVALSLLYNSQQRRRKCLFNTKMLPHPYPTTGPPPGPALASLMSISLFESTSKLGEQAKSSEAPRQTQSDNHSPDGCQV